MKLLSILFKTTAVGAIMISTAGSAAVLRFTATSASYGLLGYVEYDSSVFNGTSSQRIGNSNILALNFVNPITFQVVNTAGPVGDGAWFDSTGALPTLQSGSGYTGGTSANGVWFSSTYYVNILGAGFEDVAWRTSAVTGSVPEPATWAMIIGGFGAIGGTMRYRRRKVSVSFA